MSQTGRNSALERSVNKKLLALSQLLLSQKSLIVTFSSQKK